MKYVILGALPFVVMGLVLGLVLWMGKSKSPRAVALAERLGIRKADEMERMIQYRSVEIAYLAVMVSLLGITCYSVFVKGESIPLSNLALLIGVFTQAGAVLVLRHRSTQGDEEYRTAPLWQTTLLILGFAAVIGAIGIIITTVVLAS